MMYTTFKQLRDIHACSMGYNKLVYSFTGEQHIGVGYADEPHQHPIALTYIMEKNDILDAVWTLQTQTVVDSLNRDICEFCIDVMDEIKHHLSPQSLIAFENLVLFFKSNHTDKKANDVATELWRHVRDMSFRTGDEYAVYSAHNALVNLYRVLNNGLRPNMVASYAFDVVQNVVRCDDMYTDAKPFFVKLCNKHS
ncbi:MAG: hypothetical protein ACRC3J_05075 [Culicoidibacterales bacterium]